MSSNKKLKNMNAYMKTTMHVLDICWILFLFKALKGDMPHISVHVILTFCFQTTQHLNITVSNYVLSCVVV